MLDPDTNLKIVKTIMAAWKASFKGKEKFRLDIFLTPEQLLPAVQRLVDTQWGYLSTITGLDHPTTGDQLDELEVLYHFCDGAVIVTLRVHVPYTDPILPSVCKLIPYASLYERELMEMLGVRIPDSPDQDHLILPDDWPTDLFPLRKSFTGLTAAQKAEAG